jgi:hypothetical protein
MKIIKPGIYYDFPITAYHDDPCPEPSFSQSLGKVLIDRSPAHAKLAHPRLTPPTPEDADEKYVKVQAIGSAAHALLIGRGADIAIGKFDSWRTKEAQAFRADALAAGKIAILNVHFNDAHALMRSTRAQLAAAHHEDAFNSGAGEVVLAWQEDGFWFRTMIDWLVDTTRPYDLKTSGLPCAPHAVVDRPVEQGWNFQAAMHERGLDILDPDNAGRRKFHFVAQENEPPYGLTVVEISEADLTLGRKQLEHAIIVRKTSMSTGFWPCYPPETVQSSARPWRERQWLEREISYDDRLRRDAMLPSLMGG